jgi:hypothetical protein
LTLAATLTAGTLTAAPVVLRAQSSPPPVRSLAPTGSKSSAREEIPESHLPPKGMCRIWIDNVPPAQQPAPTDCASAIKNRPPNGRVIFPEDGARSSKGDRAKDGRGDGDAKDDKAGKSSKGKKPSKPRRP